MLEVPSVFRHTEAARRTGVRGANSGRRIKGWLDLDAKKLAKYLGVSDGHLRLAITGRAPISRHLLVKVADALGVTMRDVEELVQKAKAKYV